MDGAVCAQADPEAWHPGIGQASAPAVAICRQCPVIAACLAHALADPSLTGVWGGTSERSRRQLRKAVAA